MVLGKKLRLAVAAKTDVGLRRERNQDNTTHYVPADERELAEKGALFVVCDGMGGHAAGEVAAEMGVETIRREYFAHPPADIISSIADAIKAANEGIYTYARSHPEMSGMGTTCVTLVVQGGRAYVVNIGDSRAYILRNSVMRQVTQDHSWVAEQVRAGVLTEEQARSHAHRNVITRSLGTQPTVTADLFIETLAEGDRMLLCSDGLHGYVEEAEIERELLRHDEPDEGVNALIAMANDNGGPDNITAVVVHLLELPPVTDELMLPPSAMDIESGTTQPLPAFAAPTVPKEKRAARPSTRPAAASVTPSSPRTGSKPRSRGGRVALAAVRVLALAAMIAIGFGVWDVAYGPYSTSRATAAQVQGDISSARQAIQQAKSQDPAQALTTLAQAQQRLYTDLHNGQIDDGSKSSLSSVLYTELTPAVQDALTRYDTNNHITPVSPTGLQTYSVSCPPPASAGAGGAAAPLTGITAFTAVSAPAGKPGAPSPSAQTLYALSSGALYQLVAPLDAMGAATSGGLTCFPIAVLGASSIVALAADGPALYALITLAGGASQVVAIQPLGTNADGSPKVRTLPLAGVPAVSGQTPALLAVSGNTAYVSYTGGSGAPGVWVLVSGAKGSAPTIALPQAAVSLTTSGGTLYALLADGNLGQIGTNHQFVPLPAAVQPPAFTGTPNSYSGTAVPTPSATPTTSSGVFGPSAVLVADPALPLHLLVGDAAHSRIVRLTAGTDATISVGVQYVYGLPLTQVQQLAVSSNKTLLNLYVWNGANLAAFSVPEPAP
jgi:serine/threonine protein phosphatase PrpC